jgi:hypothetical protein
MDNSAGWRPDPERDDQERYWSGAAWTDRVRPAGKSGSLHLPEHVPELQRALSAATADIDAVEDRLATLFHRTDGSDGADRTARTSHAAATPRAASPPPPASRPPAPTGDDGDDIIELFDERDVADDEADDDDRDDDRDEDDDVGSLTIPDVFAEPTDASDDEDNAAFAELDAALAAEEPDEPEDSASPGPKQSKRGLFRRHP